MRLWWQFGPMPDSRQLRSILVGTALGDSVGLPAEGLSRKRIARHGWAGSWRQRFIFGPWSVPWRLPNWQPAQRSIKKLPWRSWVDLVRGY